MPAEGLSGVRSALLGGEGIDERFSRESYRLFMNWHSRGEDNKIMNSSKQSDCC